MFKFIHAADIHLDSAQKGLAAYEGAPVEACRGATRRAFANVVQLAIDEQAAFVVIAGDLYDGDWTDYNTGLFLVGQAARLRDHGIKVYAIRGNHDAANQMTKDLRLPDNVRLLSGDQPETVIDDELGVAIHGQSFATRKIVHNMAQGYPDRVAGCLNLGVLHTCLSGREGHESYAPCSIDDLRSRGYDYWALGHVHAHEILREGDPWIVFPGNTQGRHARETGPKGCMVAVVDDSRRIRAVRRHVVDVARWEACEIGVAGARDLDEILPIVESRLGLLLAECDRDTMVVRLVLRGACLAHYDLVARSTATLNEIRGVAVAASMGRIWIEKAIVNTTPPGASASAVDDGAIGEIDVFLDELIRDPLRRETFVDSSFDEVRRKLPQELAGLLTDPERHLGWLGQVGPLLRARLDPGTGRQPNLGRNNLDDDQ